MPAVETKTISPAFRLNFPAKEIARWRRHICLKNFLDFRQNLLALIYKHPSPLEVD